MGLNLDHTGERGCGRNQRGAVGTAKFPGIKIHDTRVVRLIEVLLYGGTTVGGGKLKKGLSHLAAVREKFLAIPI
jgi:hypothetical protein